MVKIYFKVVYATPKSLNSSFNLLRVKLFPNKFHRQLENMDSLFVNDFYEVIRFPLATGIIHANSDYLRVTKILLIVSKANSKLQIGNCWFYIIWDWIILDM